MSSFHKKALVRAVNPSTFVGFLIQWVKLFVRFIRGLLKLKDINATVLHKYFWQVYFLPHNVVLFARCSKHVFWQRKSQQQFHIIVALLIFWHLRWEKQFAFGNVRAYLFMIPSKFWLLGLIKWWSSCGSRRILFKIWNYLGSYQWCDFHLTHWW